MYQYVVPCLMGVEGLVADELKYKGFEHVEAENGRVLFQGDLYDGARANVQLRCGERVLIRLASYPAKTFDELFEGMKAIHWEQWIGKDDAFPVKGYSIHSQLHSVPDCQRILKKAAVERMKLAYNVTWLEETGPKHQIQFSLMNDRCEIFLDTTGNPLYKRGYKLEQNDASMRETLAASMVKLARWKGREVFTDPFCGSGTIAIEAALTALNIAPGKLRTFEAETWNEDWAYAFSDAREEAAGEEMLDKQLQLFASDIDEASVELAEENARRAGVADYIQFSVADACRIDWRQRGGVVICNPPYGVRMMDQEQAKRLARAFGRATGWNRELKLYIISSDMEFEESFGRPADKKRKLYNGMLKCNLYQYFQPKLSGEFKKTEQPARPREYGKFGDDRKPREYGKFGDDRKPREYGKFGDDRKPRQYGKPGEDRKPREYGKPGEYRKPRAFDKSGTYDRPKQKREER